MNNLTCPKCRTDFTNVTIRDGAVRCPSCDEIMFVYREPGDENMTPAQFMGLMDKRGRDAGRAAARWMGRGRVPVLVRVGIFIAFIWPHLAATFAKEEQA